MTELPDFDKLRWLAENEPDELEELQQTLCKEAIDSCPESNKEQLISMQFHLKQQLSLCSNPYHRCYLAIKIMNDKFIALNTIMNSPEEFRQQNAKILILPAKKAID
ncbi:DUF3135 domain-containing protein [Shewanella violacea]|uniref:DUF3135 domain-containing protein n=1 Tax=Shewanella violacea (strain JCM 10179 / CIP 106290 / LMG 19151 / DSS12) TaxID=637905 RepID=D4ZJ56_SHEVD|nr:DUF3135 domain-containing protein [Shewanella violacea]BAJ01705.1 hypothetical protein SVI_1734 [Shewanella violacea DSS12]